MEFPLNEFFQNSEIEHFYAIILKSAAGRIEPLKFRPHRTRSAAADCGLCPLRNVTF